MGTLSFTNEMGHCVVNRAATVKISADVKSLNGLAVREFTKSELRGIILRLMFDFYTGY